MIKYASQSGRPTYGLNHFVVDTESEIANLPKSCHMGSTATVVATGNTYMLNSSKQWIKQPITSGGGSGSSEGSGNITVLDDQSTSQDDSIIIL